MWGIFACYAFKWERHLAVIVGINIRGDYDMIILLISICILTNPSRTLVGVQVRVESTGD